MEHLDLFSTPSESKSCRRRSLDSPRFRIVFADIIEQSPHVPGESGCDEIKNAARPL
jgi:hypothetical protein